VVIAVLRNIETPLNPASIEMLESEAIWAGSIEISFGRTYSKGLIELLSGVETGPIQFYVDTLHNAVKKGSTLGRLLARHLVHVLKTGDSSLRDHFFQAIDIMLEKGVYTLKGPLESVSHILDQRDFTSAGLIIEILKTVFSRPLSYNRSLHFVHTLPRAVRSFPMDKRILFLKGLLKVMSEDVFLMDPFLEGIDRGLGLLTETAPDQFLYEGVEKYQKDKALGRRFLSLKSKYGKDTCDALQIAVSLFNVQAQLNLYLKAGTGLNLTVRPLSVIGAAFKKEEESYSLTDGNHIFLPDILEMYPEKSKNNQLYKLLAKLEAGSIEFGTFDFDYDKLLDHLTAESALLVPQIPQKQDSDPVSQENSSDFVRFFNSFSNPWLAEDLFVIFEHCRLHTLFAVHYKGFAKRIRPVLREEAERIRISQTSTQNRFLFGLYQFISMNLPINEIDRLTEEEINNLREIRSWFEDLFKADQTVEISGQLVLKAYEPVSICVALSHKENATPYIPLKVPFCRKISHDLYFSAHLKIERISRDLQKALIKKGLKVYKSDLKKCLMNNRGTLSCEEIKDLIVNQGDMTSGVTQTQTCELDLSWLNLDDIIRDHKALNPVDTCAHETIFNYREWDCHLSDYLKDHVRVTERIISGSNGHYYQRVLNEYQGLVKKIRYAFELLKPESLSILRQWPEGDAFDYRALMDFAMDKRAGLIPSDKLYIKRIKQQRDVAVMLLVDISRSTAHLVNGTSHSVLDIEKQALVLFCEALLVVGDSFALSGFSGTGRSGVDFYKIKEFSDPFNRDVKNRINMISPQRSTRMGAAIRHASHLLSRVSSKVRLLIILGDGFPNDLDYKGEYAILDTQKAISEARAKAIHVKAITVNMDSDSRFDALYGNLHHTIISDVRQLPDKLLRVYSTLTRH